MSQYVYLETTAADAWVEWCDRCNTVHTHARIYVMAQGGNPMEAVPATFCDCAHQYDRLWQEGEE